MNDERRNSSVEVNAEQIDERPLTDLERPYEHSQLQQASDAGEEQWIPQPIVLDQPLFEQIDVRQETNGNELLPSLPPSSVAAEIAMEREAADEAKKIPHVAPSATEDVLGNQSLLKQVDEQRTSREEKGRGSPTSVFRLSGKEHRILVPRAVHWRSFLIVCSWWKISRRRLV